MTEDTRQGGSEAQRRSQRVGLIDRIAEETGITDEQATMAVAMVYEKLANGIDAQNTPPTADELVTVLRMFAARCRAACLPDLPAISVLDAFEDWA